MINYKIERLTQKQLDAICGWRSFLKEEHIDAIFSHYLPYIKKQLKIRNVKLKIELQADFFASIDVIISIYKISKNNEFIGTFKLHTLHHQCSTMVSGATDIRPTFRNKGLFTILQYIKEDIARFMNFTYLMQTVKEDQVYAIKTIKKAKSKLIFAGINKRTKNNISIYLKKL